MAINTSNSNFVNISNLPQVQEAVDGDLLIVQTENGTQTINFQNLNVVKTDAAGNATVVGELTGTIAFLDTLSAGGTVSSYNFRSNNQTGVFKNMDFYNRLTINGGLVTSADYVLGSPEYDYITTTVIPSVTSFQNTLYKYIIDLNGQATIAGGNTNVAASFSQFFNTYPNISIGSIRPFHFMLAVNTRLSSFPWVDNIAQDPSNNLTFTINAGYGLPSNTIIFYRLLYTYNG